MSGVLALHFADPNADLGWNPITDLQHLLHYDFMRNALAAGIIVSVVAGVVGYFVVLRGLAFAGHALSHIGYAGATGAVIVGVDPLEGLLAFCVGSAMTMGALGKRLYNRDVAIGIVMAASLGLGQLFVSQYRGGGNSTESYSILFGQILGISHRDIEVTLVVSAVTLLLMAALYRPLLFASLDADVAEARGVRTRWLAVAFMGIIGLTVAQAVQVTGVLLIFCLLVAPAAIAQRLTARPALGVLVSVALSVAFTVTALCITYFQGSLPVSFLLTGIASAAYVATRLTGWVAGGVSRRGAVAVAAGSATLAP